MKGTNRSWRAQKGSKVTYAYDRISGEGVVIRVVTPPVIGKGDGEGVYVVRDTKTGEDHTVTAARMRFPKA